MQFDVSMLMVTLIEFYMLYVAHAEETLFSLARVACHAHDV